MTLVWWSYKSTLAANYNSCCIISVFTSLIYQFGFIKGRSINLVIQLLKMLEEWTEKLEMEDMYRCRSFIQILKRP